MNQPANPEHVSPPWLLIFGLVLGVGLVAFVAWDSIVPQRKNAPAVSAHVIELTNANWQKEVLESDIPVFVDFSAEWCGPCIQFAPTVHKLAERFKGRVKVGTFDVGNRSFNKGGKVTAQYRISGIPHLMLFKGGRPVPLEADRTEEDLARAIESVLGEK